MDTLAEISTLDINFKNNDEGASDAVSFDYVWIEVANQAPSVPIPSSPPHDSFTSDNTPTFQWQASIDPEGDPINYSIQVDNDVGFGSPVVDITGLSTTSYTPTTELSDGTYYWHVRAVDNNSNESNWSSSWKVTVFVAEVNFSMNASPNNLTMTQGKSAVSTVSVSLVSGWGQVSLSGAWMGIAPTGISAVFSPQSGTPPFSSILTFTASSTASGGTFIYEVAGSGGGLTRTDTITLMLPPAVPSLISPENGGAIDTITPTFDWADVSGASSYTLQVATDNDFSYTVFSTQAIESTAVPPVPLSYGTRYYWRVRAKNNVGTGDWSSTWSFIAKSSAPKILSFEIEARSQYTNSMSVELTISARNATEMQFSSDGLAWGEWEPYQTSKSYTLETLDGSKNIYIRVRDNAGDIGQIVLGSIILDQTPPSTVHSVSGELGNLSYKSPAVVTLTTTDAYGVESTKYRLDAGEWQTGQTFVISSEGNHTIEYYSTDKAGNVEEIKSFEVTVYTSAIIPYFGPFIEEILSFLHQMGPIALITIGFVVLFVGMTRSLAALVGFGMVLCGLLILMGFL